MNDTPDGLELLGGDALAREQVRDGATIDASESSQSGSGVIGVGVLPSLDVSLHLLARGDWRRRRGWWHGRCCLVGGEEPQDTSLLHDQVAEQVRGGGLHEVLPLAEPRVFSVHKSLQQVVLGGLQTQTDDLCGGLAWGHLRSCHRVLVSTLYDLVHKCFFRLQKHHELSQSPFFVTSGGPSRGLVGCEVAGELPLALLADQPGLQRLEEWPRQ